MNNDPSFADEAALAAYWESIAQPGTWFELDGGGHVAIMSIGRRNKLAGPDYEDAVVLLGGHVVCGMIEIHTAERDWFSHGHHRDERYERVVLHVVANRSRRNRLNIPTVVVMPAHRNVPASFVDATGSTAVSGSFLASLSWDRLMRLVGDVRDAIDQGGDSRARIWLLERACSILGRPGNVSHVGQIVARLISVLDSGPLTTSALGDLQNLARTQGGWGRGVRPTARAEQRLRALARIGEGLVHGDLLQVVASACVRNSVASAASRLADFDVGLGTERCRTLVVDCFVPLAVALSIHAGETAVVAHLLESWRWAPSLGSNSLIREFEQRHLGGKRLRGAFWQWGAMEFVRRYGINTRRKTWRIRETPVCWAAAVPGGTKCLRRGISNVNNDYQWHRTPTFFLRPTRSQIWWPPVLS